MTHFLRRHPLYVCLYLSLLLFILVCRPAAISPSPSFMTMTSHSLERVAVIGGGFSGLSTAYYLSQLPRCKGIDVYDVLPPGRAGASSAAGGLLHPFAPRGNLLWRGKEGYEQSLALAKTLEENAPTYYLSSPGGAVKQKSFIKEQPIVRPIFTNQDLSLWSKAKSAHPQWLELITAEELRTKFIPYSSSRSNLTSEAMGGVLIHKASIIDAIPYLETLWQAVLHQCDSSRWISDSVITDIAPLSSQYGTIIVAAGIGTQMLWSSGAKSNNNFDISQTQFKLKYVRGQNIFYENIDTPLTAPLLCGEYIVPKSSSFSEEFQVSSNSGTNQVLMCGATHEHIRLTSQSDVISALTAKGSVAEARTLLDNKLQRILPATADMRPLQVNTGVRLATERTNFGKLPIVGRHPVLRNVWVLSGLGSRGLVYHALMAKYLTEAIASDDESVIPECLLPANHLQVK